MNPEHWEQVDKLLEQALEQKTDRRAAFLDEACNGDLALRQELESLLSAHGKSGDFIEAPALEGTVPATQGAAVRIAAGQPLGPYKILSLVGAGGMGEVYRAKDDRIGREVAIKVLPPAFSADADRLRRFEQEARAAGRINHPNILALYDVGTHDGSPYIVSELLHGETLGDRQRGKALPLRKAIDYALQMARGLAAAHEKGIVHRDLKPENLFITTDGRVKILDFGLAKLQPKRAKVTDTDVSTQTFIISTEPGVVLGTLGYMSPEQVRGESTDHRSDIFAFGAILYEMLSGQRGFQAKSPVETMNAILKEEPPALSKANGEVPRALEHIVRHCLEKAPEQRFQSAHDLGFNLEEFLGSTDSTSESPTPRPERLERRQRLVWTLSGMCLLALLSAAFVAYTYFRQPRVNLQTLRFTVSPPENAVFEGSLALSPDGRWLAFVASIGNGRSLWLRPLDSTAARALRGTEGAMYPFWSPDSRFIAFFAQGKLKKMEIPDGHPQILCEASSSVSKGGTWNRDGVIVFAPRYRDPLYRVSAAGGEPTPVTNVDRAASEAHLWPHFLPDGHHFLYQSKRFPVRSLDLVRVGSLDGKEKSRFLLEANSNLAYASPGYLLFERQGKLLAQRFDADRLQIKGEAVVLTEGGILGAGFGSATFSVTENSLGYIPGAAGSRSQLVWFSRQGESLGAVGHTGRYENPWLSPDEKRVVFSGVDAQSTEPIKGDVWQLPLFDGIPSRFTFHPSVPNRFPIWSPDGSRVVFSANRTGFFELYQKPSSGAGDDELLLETRTSKMPTDWSRDGRFIVYLDILPKTQFDLWVLPLFGDRRPQPFAQREFNEKQGRLSPDGRWMAYASDETGKYEVYVQPFPPTGGKFEITTSGGEQPSWQSDGKELFYVGEGQKLIVVGVDASSPTFRASPPRELFQMRSPIEILTRNQYAVTADGQRFLVNTLVEPSASPPITVVINWSAGLKR